MVFSLKTFVILLTLNSCLCQQPADKKANAKTKQTLDFIAGLPKKGKYLSGQFGGFSQTGFNLSQMKQIKNVTGQTPAILGCDYAYGWDHTIPPQALIDYTCNQALIDHSNNNGIVTVETHFPNPSSPDAGDVLNRLNLTFTDLLKPETETGQRWRSFLDIVAQGFNELQQANVTILYRPFHEMNGNWFWWGQQDPIEYRNVWISVFNYFCNEKNLHNLLWIYAPGDAATNLTLYYPGDDYVDIVGLDVYVDDPNLMTGYDEMIKLNKPFALAELGANTLNSRCDFSLWPIAIEKRFNQVSYFLGWRDRWSPIANRNAYQLYNNMHVINREQL